MEIIESLKELLGWDDPPVVVVPKAQRRIQAKASIEAWLERQTTPQYKLAPYKFAERLRALVDAPQTLRQGAYGWCLPAAFLNSVLRRFPDVAVQFGLDLYATGEASIGDIEATMSDTFRAFDYPEAIRAAYGSDERARDLFLLSHADWLLLAGIEQATHAVFSVTGEFNQLVSLTTGALVKLFEDSGLYAAVSDLSAADKRDRQKLLEALNKSATHDVVMVADMKRFGPTGLTRHAGRLVSAPTVTTSGNSTNPADNEMIALQYWSWGFQPTRANDLPFDAEENAFTISMSRRQFINVDIVVAEPKPI